MVMPGTLPGMPARRAAWRATLNPVHPCCNPQPRTTSSTASVSKPARSNAALMACAARACPWVLLKAPRYALPMGVRATETMTASRMSALLDVKKQWTDRVDSGGSRNPVPAAPGGGGLLEQPRRLPALARLAMEAADRLVDSCEPERLSPPHGSAAIARKAVAIDVDDIDVARPLRNAFLQNTSALVDHCAQQPVQDVLARDWPAVESELRRHARVHQL